MLENYLNCELLTLNWFLNPEFLKPFEKNFEEALKKFIVSKIIILYLFVFNKILFLNKILQINTSNKYLK